MTAEKPRPTEWFTPQNVTSVFLALMVTVYLFGFGPGGYTTITHVKLGFFYILCGLYFLTAGISVFFCRGKIKGKKMTRRNAYSVVYLFLLLFWLSCAVSAFVSSYFPGTLLGFHRFEGLLTISCYVGIFFLTARFSVPEEWLLWICAASVTLFCLLCFVQLAGWNPFTLYPEGMNYYDGNDKYHYFFLGTVGNVDLAAAVLSLFFGFFTAAFLRIKQKRRFLLLIPVCCVLAVLILSSVAAGLVAAVLGLTFMVPCVLLRKKKQKLIAWLLIFVIAVSGMGYVYGSRAESGMVYEAHELMHGNFDDDFGTGRVFIWKNVVKLIPESLLFGGGCDTLGERMEVAFERFDEEKNVNYRAVIDTAHCEYLNVLVNEGLFAFVFYLSALVLFFLLYLFRGSRNDILAVCGSGVFLYCIQALFGIRMILNAPFFWLCFGVACSGWKHWRPVKRRKQAVQVTEPAAAETESLSVPESVEKQELMQ